MDVTTFVTDSLKGKDPYEGTGRRICAVEKDKESGTSLVKICKTAYDINGKPYEIWDVLDDRSADMIQEEIDSITAQMNSNLMRIADLEARIAALEGS